MIEVRYCCRINKGGGAKGHALEFSVKPGLPSSRGKVAVQTRARVLATTAARAL